MRVTITIDEEKVFQTGMEQGQQGDVATTAGEQPAEAKPMNAGGPPAWLLQELGGMAAEPDPGQMAMDPMDAGPAPAASGNGPAPMQAHFGRGS
jgi:hypothetical protein